MGSHWRRLRAPAAVLATVALVALGPGAASADDKSLKDAISSIEEGMQPDDSETQDQQVPEEAGPAAGEPTEDDDSAGHETEDPTPPDHGRGTVADGKIADQDLATVGDSDGTVEDDDSTKADATLLAIGGQEVMGAHADSEDTEESHFGDPLAPLCEGSEGQLCLRILYADAWATDDGDTSSSRSQSGVADVCLGGSDSAPDAECSGNASASVASSEGEAERDQASGRTTASSKSHIADVCLKEDPAAEGCSLGVGALHSEGQSDSGGAEGTAERDSYLLAVEGEGEEQGRYGDPTAISLPPDCPEGESLVCVFLNQGETYVGEATGHAQEALHVDVLPGNLDLLLEVSRTESLVHNDGGERDEPEVKGVESPSGGPGAPGDDGSGGDMLPNTGGFWSGLLALGLGGVGIGTLLTVLGRRRTADFA